MTLYISVFVLKNIETSTINSNQPIIQQLFFELLSSNINGTQFFHLYYTHSCLPGPMTHGNEQADKVVSFATLEKQHALLHNNACSLHQLWTIPYCQAKEIISNCSTCRSHIFDPLHKVLILAVCNLMNYGKWM